MSDRTHEFLQYVQQNAQAVDVLKPRPPDPPKTKSAFHDAAAEIARGIHKASGSLTRLTSLVRRQGLFDDPTEEINNLIYRIKQDLDELNTKCDSAQQYVESLKKSGGENQTCAYNVKVVTQLKSDLMGTTKNFKSVLEVRSGKMKDQQQRRVELTGQSTLSPMRQFNASLKREAGGGSGTSEHKMGDGIVDMSMSPYAKSSSLSLPQANQQQQLLLAPPSNAQYYESREAAVTEVEKTIGELGTLFKRLATMISEQQELVERIDEDVESAVTNSDLAHKQLLSLYEGVSSNRGMYMKLFAIFGVFILFFVIFLM